MSLTKFCIYHQPRTGSTMLWGLLGHHPQIVCEGEILHPYHQKHIYSQYKTFKECIETLYYPEIREGHKAFGFKLQGYQARPEIPNESSEGELLDVRDYLKNNNYKFIIPYRLNKLEQYVSQEVAKQRDIWQRWTEWDGTNRNDPEFELLKIKVTKDIFSKWYKWDHDMVRKMEREVEGQKVLRVTYERVLLDWENQINRMLGFLDVDLVSGLEPKTKKARSQPLREWIENYEEACEIHDSIATPHEIEYRIEHEA